MKQKRPVEPLPGQRMVGALGRRKPHHHDALVDFDAYRRANDMRTVRKNVTLQSWLNDLAEKAGVNFSQVLQDALKQRLGVTDR